MTDAAEIDATWLRIERWLAQSAPEAKDCLAAGLTPEQLADLERELGAELPDQVRAWFSRCGGQAQHQSLLPRWELSRPDDVVSTWRMHASLKEDGLFDDEADIQATGAVRAEWWNAGWIPVATDAAGNLLCIDLAPAAGGCVGQVIEWMHDWPERRVLAPSLCKFLAQIADDLDSGRAVVVEDAFGFAGVKYRSELAGTRLKVRGEAGAEDPTSVGIPEDVLDDRATAALLDVILGGRPMFRKDKDEVEADPVDDDELDLDDDELERLLAGEQAASPAEDLRAARVLVDLLVDREGLELTKGANRDGISAAIAPILATEADDETRAAAIALALVDCPGVEDVFISDEELAAILEQGW